jgi:phage terminase large subunit-like protein
MELAGKYSATFVMDSYVLQDLYVMLKQRGYNVFGASNRDLMSASNNAYRKIMKREVQHPKDELVTLQIQAAVRKNVNESWKISRKDSSIEIDAAIATVLAIWFADSRELQMPGLV